MTVVRASAGATDAAAKPVHATTPAFSDADAVAECKIAFHASSLAGMTYRLKITLLNARLISTTIATLVITTKRRNRARASSAFFCLRSSSWRADESAMNSWMSSIFKSPGSASNARARSS